MVFLASSLPGLFVGRKEKKGPKKKGIDGERFLDFFGTGQTLDFSRFSAGDFDFLTFR